MRIRVYPVNGTWHWAIVAGNNQIMARSCGYTTRSHAKRAAWRVWNEFTSGNVKVEEEA